MRRVSNVTIVGGIIALICLAIAAAVLIDPGANDRVALVFGVIGLALPVFLSNLKADQAASQTNGSLDERIRAGVYEAMAQRRRSDLVPDDETPADDRVPR